ncbi:MAG: hypothetical protein ACYDH9_20245 [Limisphaerales bacterium]
MTDLDRPVSRRSHTPFAHYRRRIVVTLEPGDVLAMRLERTRTTYRAPLSHIFRQLVEWQAQARRREKREARKNRRTP